MVFKKFLILFISFFSIYFVSFADTAPLRVPTVTRQIKIYSELEESLMTALINHDTSTLNTLIAPEFELRVSQAPGMPITKDEWLQSFNSKQLLNYELSQMAVHDFDEISLVSYQLTNFHKKNIMVVDVWKKNNDAPQLIIRYSTYPNIKFNTKKNTTIPKKY